MSTPAGGYGSEDNQPAYGPEEAPSGEVPEFVGPKLPTWTLASFFEYDPVLEGMVDFAYDGLSDEQRVGQLFVPSVGESGRFRTAEAAFPLLRKIQAGGIFLFKGNTALYEANIRGINAFFGSNGWIPPIYSVDAEPHLMPIRVNDWPSGRIETNAARLTTTAAVESAVQPINDWMKSIGAHQNFAPVLDINTNPALKGWNRRAFSDQFAKCVEMSNAFINATQKDNLIATAKHFPGLGSLSNDPHEQLVVNEGALAELDNYPPVIGNHVLSIMPTHIIARGNARGFNTENGLPAIMSRKLITDVLKGSMGFRGLVITDALNMHGARFKAGDVSIRNPGLKCIQAGCDQLLMSFTPERDFGDILAEMTSNPEFNSQVKASVKKILRLKYCLGIL